MQVNPPRDFGYCNSIIRSLNTCKNITKTYDLAFVLYIFISKMNGKSHGTFLSLKNESNNIVEFDMIFLMEARLT